MPIKDYEKGARCIDTRKVYRSKDEWGTAVRALKKVLADEIDFERIEQIARRARESREVGR